VATLTGRDWQPGSRSFEDVRQARLDVLGDLVADHLDTDAVVSLLEHGAPAGLPFVPPGAPSA
jgi:adenosylcobyric acid synthase